MEHPIHVWAYVVMPEHVHLLVWPTEVEFKISKLLETVKSSVSKRARNHLSRTNPAVIEAAGGEFHFWQPGRAMTGTSIMRPRSGPPSTTSTCTPLVAAGASVPKTGRGRVPESTPGFATIRSPSTANRFRPTRDVERSLVELSSRVSRSRSP